LTFFTLNLTQRRSRQTCEEAKEGRGEAEGDAAADRRQEAGEGSGPQKINRTTAAQSA